MKENYFCYTHYILTNEHQSTNFIKPLKTEFMKNVKKKVQELETSERVYVKGNSGTVYDFNSIPFDGNTEKLSEHLGCSYPGIYLFVERGADKELSKVLFKGESDDIAKDLENNNGKVDFSKLGATYFCYSYDDSENIRKDIKDDICEG